MSLFQLNQLVHTEEGLGRIDAFTEEGVWCEMLDPELSSDGADKEIRLFFECELKPALDQMIVERHASGPTAKEVACTGCEYCASPAVHFNRYDGNKKKAVNLCDKCLGDVEQWNQRKRDIASIFEDRETLKAVRRIGKEDREKVRFGNLRWGRVAAATGALAAAIVAGVLGVDYVMSTFF